MKISEIICPKCKSTKFKNGEGTYICETCDYALTDEDRQNILTSAYEQHKAETSENKTAKVYKMNDYEWWVSNLPIEETLAYYLKVTGVTKDDTYPVEQIKECDLDSEGMYIPLEDSEKIAELEKLGITKQIVKNGHGCGFGTVNKYDNDWYVKVPFREAMEYTGFGGNSEPVGIASTES